MRPPGALHIRFGYGLLALVTVTTVLLGAPAPARADAGAVFTYTGRGASLGLQLGLASGYLVARRGGWDRSEDWRPLVMGAGVGALAGGALGLTLGIVDMARETPGMGGYILRDMLYGTGFGVAAGAIVGVLVFTSSEDPEHIAFGAAVGALAGAGIGLVLGVFEGSRAAGRTASSGDGRARGWTVTVATAPSAGSDLVWMPAVLGRF